MTRPPIDPRWPDLNPNLPQRDTGAMHAQVVPGREGETRLKRCARCYEDATEGSGRPMYGVLVDDLGAVPVITVTRELARTRLLIRLRLCNSCYAEAQSYAMDMSQ